LLALLARDGWQTAMPELGKSAFFVRHEAYLLPGSFVMGAAVRPAEAANALSVARNVLNTLASAPPSTAELERVRNEALAIYNKQLDEPAALANLWLDLETFKLPSIDEQLRSLSRVTPADIQRVAARLFRDAPVATVAVGSADQLAADLRRSAQIEIFGAPEKPDPKNTSAPSKAP